MITKESTASVEFPGITHDFTVLECEIILDDLNTIYCRAQLRLAPVPDAILADLDPRSGSLRATVTRTQTFIAPSPDTQTRTFDLFVHDRVANADGTVSLELGSDEAVLELRALVDTHPTDRYWDGTSFYATAREVIDEVLDEYIPGAALEAGTVDADVTRTLTMTNLMPNPSMETNITGWVANSGVTSVNQSSSFASRGTYSLRCIMAAGDGSVRYDPLMNVDQLTTYRFAFKVRSQVSRAVDYLVRFYDATGTLLTSYSFAIGVVQMTSTSAFTQVVRYCYAPDKSSSARVYIIFNGNASGNAHYIDEVEFTKVDDARFDGLGDEYPFVGNESYFDGTGDADAAVAPFYTYAWTGTAHASTSTRTSIDERAFDLLLQQPGVAVRKFLDPIVELTGGRLFCDENRDWRLVDDTYTVAGTIEVAATVDIVRAEDKISLSESYDGVPTSFSGVVLEYIENRRSDGRTITRWDSAGDDSGRVYRRTIQGPFPGPGAAAAILARAAGRGRQVPVTALANLDATPGMAIEITRGATTLTGVISRVSFSWSTDGESDLMEISARELA